VAALITLQQAIRHVKAPFEADALPESGVEELELLMEQATALCLAYTERAVDDQSPPWTSATSPATDAEFAMLQAGILRMLMHLWRWRGDDEKAPAWSPYDLPADVTMILRILKDPTLA
jgi:hypothetical protein